jgi:hypothetical protein
MGSTRSQPPPSTVPRGLKEATGTAESALDPEEPKPATGTLAARGRHTGDNRGDDVTWNAGTGIATLQQHHVVLLHQCVLEGDLAAVGHRLDGVLHQVVKRAAQEPFTNGDACRVAADGTHPYRRRDPRQDVPDIAAEKGRYLAFPGIAGDVRQLGLRQPACYCLRRIEMPARASCASSRSVRDPLSAFSATRAAVISFLRS